jgi:hypothetical protein
MLHSLPSPSCTLPVARKSELTAWLSRARPGDRIVYHQGFLAVDCGCTSSLQKRERHRLDAWPQLLAQPLRQAPSISSRSATGLASSITWP